MRGVAAIAIAALAIACGGQRRAGAPSNERPPATARGPAPAIRYTGEPGAWFVLDRLPAIAADGELAVVAVRDPDGGRGYPNLTLVVRGRDDRVIDTLELLAASDYEALAPDDRPGPELARRISAANDHLARMHLEHDLVTVTPMALDPADDATPQHARAGSLEVTWASPRLTVTDVARGLKRTLGDATWLAHGPARCAADNTAYLASAYIAPDVPAVIVEIAYRGTDTCWEPASQTHFISW